MGEQEAQVLRAVFLDLEPDITGHVEQSKVTCSLHCAFLAMEPNPACEERVVEYIRKSHQAPHQMVDFVKFSESMLLLVKSDDVCDGASGTKSVDSIRRSLIWCRLGSFSEC